MKNNVDSQLFVKNKLELLSKEIEGLKFRYEYQDFMRNHIVEITPLDVYESDKNYRNLELLIESEFETKFPDEEILFVTEGSLIKISEENISFAGNQSFRIQLMKSM